MAEIGLSLLGNIPGMVAWLTGVTLAIIMLRRGGAKAEILLLIGCGLMLAEKLINPLLSGLVRWVMSEQGMSNVVTAQTMGLVRLPLVIMTIGALVCLIWAFWLKFWVKRKEAA